MATIGFDGVYYAPVTEAATTGYETYGTPVALAGGIQADITIETNDAELAADDGIFESVKEFKKGTLSLKVAELERTAAVAMLGVTADNKGVVVSTAEDVTSVVAIGFRARKANGNYRYFWLYRVKFSIPATNLATKGDTITFNTPTLEGTIMRRNKPDTRGKHPWKVEATEGDPGIDSAVINGWTNGVYEPTYASQSHG